MSKTYSERKKELEFENLSKFAENFLKSPLEVDTDYEPENEGDPIAYRTVDRAFSFVPQLDDPVMSERTLRGSSPIPGTYRWSVEIGVSSGGSYWEPPDYDVVEIARENTLYDAIGAAAHWILDQQMDSEDEGMFWSTQNILDNEFPAPMDY